MRLVSFYNRETGLFNGDQVIASVDSAIDAHTPAGHIAIDGHHDPLSKRVDIASGLLVDYKPPAPDAYHDWNASTHRWELCPSARATNARRAAAALRIAALEASQHRHMREHVLGVPTALGELQAIDVEIRKLSADL